MNPEILALPKPSAGEKNPIPPPKSLQIDDLSMWKKLPYDSKYPLPKRPKKDIELCTKKLGKPLYESYPGKDFDLSTAPVPSIPAQSYNSLHDPSLRLYFQSALSYRNLVRKGFITTDGKVKSQIAEYNQYRMYLHHLWAMHVNHLRRNQEVEEQKRLESLLEAVENEDSLCKDILDKQHHFKADDVLDDLAVKLARTKDDVLESSENPLVRSFINWNSYQNKLQNDYKDDYPVVKQWLNDQTKNYKCLMEKKMNDRKCQDKNMRSRWEKLKENSRNCYNRIMKLQEKEAEKKRILSEKRQNLYRKMWNKDIREIHERVRKSTSKSRGKFPSEEESITSYRSIQDSPPRESSATHDEKDRQSEQADLPSVVCKKTGVAHGESTSYGTEMGSRSDNESYNIKNSFATSDRLFTPKGLKEFSDESFPSSTRQRSSKYSDTWTAVSSGQEAMTSDNIIPDICEHITSKPRLESLDNNFGQKITTHVSQDEASPSTQSLYSTDNDFMKESLNKPKTKRKKRVKPSGQRHTKKQQMIADKPPPLSDNRKEIGSTGVKRKQSASNERQNSKISKGQSEDDHKVSIRTPKRYSSLGARDSSMILKYLYGIPGSSNATLAKRNTSSDGQHEYKFEDRGSEIEDLPEEETTTDRVQQKDSEKSSEDDRKESLKSPRKEIIALSSQVKDSKGRVNEVGKKSLDSSSLEEEQVDKEVRSDTRKTGVKNKVPLARKNSKNSKNPEFSGRKTISKTCKGTDREKVTKPIKPGKDFQMSHDSSVLLPVNEFTVTPTQQIKNGKEKDATFKKQVKLSQNKAGATKIASPKFNSDEDDRTATKPHAATIKKPKIGTLKKSDSFENKRKKKSDLHKVPVSGNEQVERSLCSEPDKTFRKGTEMIPNEQKQVETSKTETRKVKDDLPTEVLTSRDENYKDSPENSLENAFLRILETIPTNIQENENGFKAHEAFTNHNYDEPGKGKMNSDECVLKNTKSSKKDSESEYKQDTDESSERGNISDLSLENASFLTTDTSSEASKNITDYLGSEATAAKELKSTRKCKAKKSASSSEEPTLKDSDALKKHPQNEYRKCVDKVPSEEDSSSHRQTKSTNDDFKREVISSAFMSRTKDKSKEDNMSYNEIPLITITSSEKVLKRNEPNNNLLDDIVKPQVSELPGSQENPKKEFRRKSGNSIQKHLFSEQDDKDDLLSLKEQYDGLKQDKVCRDVVKPIDHAPVKPIQSPEKLKENIRTKRNLSECLFLSPKHLLPRGSIKDDGFSFKVNGGIEDQERQVVGNEYSTDSKASNQFKNPEGLKYSIQSERNLNEIFFLRPKHPLRRLDVQGADFKSLKTDTAELTENFTSPTNSKGSNRYHYRNILLELDHLELMSKRPKDLRHESKCLYPKQEREETVCKMSDRKSWANLEFQSLRPEETNSRKYVQNITNRKSWANSGTILNIKKERPGAVSFKGIYDERKKKINEEFIRCTSSKRNFASFDNIRMPAEATEEKFSDHLGEFFRGIYREREDKLRKELAEYMLSRSNENERARNGSISKRTQMIPEYLTVSKFKSEEDKENLKKSHDTAEKFGQRSRSSIESKTEMFSAKKKDGKHLQNSSDDVCDWVDCMPFLREFKFLKLDQTVKEQKEETVEEKAAAVKFQLNSTVRDSLRTKNFDDASTKDEFVKETNEEDAKLVRTPMDSLTVSINWCKDQKEKEGRVKIEESDNFLQSELKNDATESTEYENGKMVEDTGYTTFEKDIRKKDDDGISVVAGKDGKMVKDTEYTTFGEDTRKRDDDGTKIDYDEVGKYEDVFTTKDGGAIISNEIERRERFVQETDGLRKPMDDVTRQCKDQKEKGGGMDIKEFDNFGVEIKDETVKQAERKSGKFVEDSYYKNIKEGNWKQRDYEVPKDAVEEMENTFKTKGDVAKMIEVIKVLDETEKKELMTEKIAQDYKSKEETVDKFKGSSKNQKETGDRTKMRKPEKCFLGEIRDTSVDEDEDGKLVTDSDNKTFNKYDWKGKYGGLKIVYDEVETIGSTYKTRDDDVKKDVKFYDEAESRVDVQEKILFYEDADKKKSGKIFEEIKPETYESYRPEVSRMKSYLKETKIRDALEKEVDPKDKDATVETNFNKADKTKEDFTKAEKKGKQEVETENITDLQKDFADDLDTTSEARDRVLFPFDRYKNEDFEDSVYDARNANFLGESVKHLYRNGATEEVPKKKDFDGEDSKKRESKETEAKKDEKKEDSCEGVKDEFRDVREDGIKEVEMKYSEIDLCSETEDESPWLIQKVVFPQDVRKERIDLEANHRNQKQETLCYKTGRESVNVSMTDSKIAQLNDFNSTTAEDETMGMETISEGNKFVTPIFQSLEKTEINRVRKSAFKVDGSKHLYFTRVSVPFYEKIYDPLFKGSDLPHTSTVPSYASGGVNLPSHATLTEKQYEMFLVDNTFSEDSPLNNEDTDITDTKYLSKFISASDVLVIDHSKRFEHISDFSTADLISHCTKEARGLEYVSTISEPLIKLSDNVYISPTETSFGKRVQSTVPDIKTLHFQDRILEDMKKQLISSLQALVNSTAPALCDLEQAEEQRCSEFYAASLPYPERIPHHTDLARVMKVSSFDVDTRENVLDSTSEFLFEIPSRANILDMELVDENLDSVMTNFHSLFAKLIFKPTDIPQRPHNDEWTNSFPTTQNKPPDFCKIMAPSLTFKNQIESQSVYLPTSGTRPSILSSESKKSFSERHSKAGMNGAVYKISGSEVNSEKQTGIPTPDAINGTGIDYHVKFDETDNLTDQLNELSTQGLKHDNSQEKQKYKMFTKTLPPPKLMQQMPAEDTDLETIVDQNSSEAGNVPKFMFETEDTAERKQQEYWTAQNRGISIPNAFYVTGRNVPIANIPAKTSSDKITSELDATQKEGLLFGSFGNRQEFRSLPKTLPPSEVPTESRHREHHPTQNIGISIPNAYYGTRRNVPIADIPAKTSSDKITSELDATQKEGLLFGSFGNRQEFHSLPKTLPPSEVSTESRYRDTQNIGISIPNAYYGTGSNVPIADIPAKTSSDKITSELGATQKEGLLFGSFGNRQEFHSLPKTLPPSEVSTESRYRDTQNIGISIPNAYYGTGSNVPIADIPAKTSSDKITSELGATQKEGLLFGSFGNRQEFHSLPKTLPPSEVSTESRYRDTQNIGISIPNAYYGTGSNVPIADIPAKTSSDKITSELGATQKEGLLFGSFGNRQEFRSLPKTLPPSEVPTESRHREHHPTQNIGISIPNAYYGTRRNVPIADIPAKTSSDKITSELDATQKEGLLFGSFGNRQEFHSLPKTLPPSEVSTESRYRDTQNIGISIPNAYYGTGSNVPIADIPAKTSSDKITSELGATQKEGLLFGSFGNRQEFHSLPKTLPPSEVSTESRYRDTQNIGISIPNAYYGTGSNVPIADIPAKTSSDKITSELGATQKEGLLFGSFGNRQEFHSLPKTLPPSEVSTESRYRDTQNIGISIPNAYYGTGSNVPIADIPAKTSSDKITSELGATQKEGLLFGSFGNRQEFHSLPKTLPPSEVSTESRYRDTQNIGISIPNAYYGTGSNVPIADIPAKTSSDKITSELGATQKEGLLFGSFGNRQEFHSLPKTLPPSEVSTESRYRDTQNIGISIPNAYYGTGSNVPIADIPAKTSSDKITSELDATQKEGLLFGSFGNRQEFHSLPKTLPPSEVSTESRYRDTQNIGISIPNAYYGTGSNVPIADIPAKTSSDKITSELDATQKEGLLFGSFGNRQEFHSLPKTLPPSEVSIESRHPEHQSRQNIGISIPNSYYGTGRNVPIVDIPVKTSSDKMVDEIDVAQKKSTLFSTFEGRQKFQRLSKILSPSEFEAESRKREFHSTRYMGISIPNAYYDTGREIAISHIPPKTSNENATDEEDVLHKKSCSLEDRQAFLTLLKYLPPSEVAIESKPQECHTPQNIRISIPNAYYGIGRNIAISDISPKENIDNTTDERVVSHKESSFEDKEEFNFLTKTLPSPYIKPESTIVLTSQENIISHIISVENNAIDSTAETQDSAEESFSVNKHSEMALPDAYYGTVNSSHPMPSSIPIEFDNSTKKQVISDNPSERRQQYQTSIKTMPPGKPKTSKISEDTAAKSKAPSSSVETKDIVPSSAFQLQPVGKQPKVLVMKGNNDSSEPDIYYGSESHEMKADSSEADTAVKNMQEIDVSSNVSEVIPVWEEKQKYQSLTKILPPLKSKPGISATDMVLKNIPLQRSSEFELDTKFSSLDAAKTLRSRPIKVNESRDNDEVKLHPSHEIFQSRLKKTEIERLQLSRDLDDVIKRLELFPLEKNEIGTSGGNITSFKRRPTQIDISGELLEVLNALNANAVETVLKNTRVKRDDVLVSFPGTSIEDEACTTKVLPSYSLNATSLDRLTLRIVNASAPYTDIELNLMEFLRYYLPHFSGISTGEHLSVEMGNWQRSETYGKADIFPSSHKGICRLHTSEADIAQEAISNAILRDFADPVTVTEITDDNIDAATEKIGRIKNFKKANQVKSDLYLGESSKDKTLEKDISNELPQAVHTAAAPKRIMKNKGGNLKNNEQDRTSDLLSDYDDLQITRNENSSSESEDVKPVSKRREAEDKQEIKENELNITQEKNNIRQSPVDDYAEQDDILLERDMEEKESRQDPPCLKMTSEDVHVPAAQVESQMLDPLLPRQRSSVASIMNIINGEINRIESFFKGKKKLRPAKRRQRSSKIERKAEKTIFIIDSIHDQTVMTEKSDSDDENYLF